LEVGVYWWSDSEKLISNYGFSVGTAGNVNGDRTDDVLIGAPLYYIALPTQGAAVIFYGMPDITATNDSPTVLGEFTTMTVTVSTSGEFTYDWDFGDGITETGQVVTHTYLEVGYFTATVTADDSTYMISTTTPITITDVPIADLLAENDSPTPLEHITTLTATVSAGTNVVYNWDFGDGITGSGVVITHTYPAVDVFTATVTATNNISTDVVTTTVTITEAAIEGLAAENDSPTAIGDTTTFSATVEYGSSVGYEWAYGDGESDVGITTTHKYADVGEYTAIVTATNSLGTDSVTTTVNIEEPISGLNAENDSPTQLGGTTTLSATITTGSNVSYSWDYGDGNFGNGINTSHVYPEVGSFTATITASNGISSLSTTTPVTITDVPIADLSASNDSPTPIGSTTTLSATISAGSSVSYEWDFGDGENGSGITTTHIYANTGYYTATVTATNSVSSDAVTTTLTINDVPIEDLAADNDSPTLIGYTTLLSATISAGSGISATERRALEILYHTLTLPLADTQPLSRRRTVSALK
jgi:PKD repeat protein